MYVGGLNSYKERIRKANKRFEERE